MSKYQVGVFVTEEDLQHPVVIKTLVMGGFINEEDVVNNKVIYTEEKLVEVLKKVFGFKRGEYEASIVGKQKTKLTGELVKNVKRYVGIERQDKAWVESEMSSKEVREIYKWGEPL